MSRAIPDDHLAYPLHVALDNGGEGSAFFVNGANRIFLVTAKHVLFSKSGQMLADGLVLTCPARDHGEQVTSCFKLDLAALQAAGQVRQHPTRDVAAIIFGDTERLPESESFTIRHTQGIDTQALSKSGVVGVSLENMKRLSDVLVGNRVFLFGYPASLGLRQQPQFDYSRPLLRSGIIAGKYAEQGTLILDCPVFPGNSGGPVVEVEQVGFNWHCRVIGVATQFVPLVEKTRSELYGYQNTSITNSGYSVAVGMDAVFEMLELSQSGASSKPA